MQHKCGYFTQDEEPHPATDHLGIVLLLPKLGARQGKVCSSLTSDPFTGALRADSKGTPPSSPSVSGRVTGTWNRMQKEPPPTCNRDTEDSPAKTNPRLSLADFNAEVPSDGARSGIGRVSFSNHCASRLYHIQPLPDLQDSTARVSFRSLLNSKAKSYPKHPPANSTSLYEYA